MKTSILDDQLFASFESSIAPIDEAEMLPPACYTDTEFHEFEKDANEWFIVSRHQAHDYRAYAHAATTSVYF